jgi:hypothetical protein
LDLGNQLEKHMVSIMLVAIFGIPLTLFAIVLALASRWLSVLLPGTISTYMVLMLLLAVGAWLSLWVCLVCIGRIESRRGDTARAQGGE